MKIFFSLLIPFAFFIVSCNKHDLLSTYKPGIPVIFSASNKMAHTMDTVNIGDTIMLTASGAIADTANTFSSALKIYSGSVSAAGVFTSSGNLVGANYVAPLQRVITAPAATSSLYGWTSIIAVPCPAVPHKTNILISASFENSISLSTQLGNQTANDSKPIFVR